MRARVALLTAVAVAAFAPPAMAGRLIVTGHDADRRCAELDQQCGFLKTAVRYVRATAPHPRRPILVLDRYGFDLDQSLDKVWGGYGAPTRTVDPRSADFAKLAIDVEHYSAIAIASDVSASGDLDAPDVAAITKRERALQKFLNAGGGIYAGAGGSDALAYYAFMPVPTPGPPGEGPFELTPYGQRIGFKPSDLTGAVANTFRAPDVGAMAVAAESTAKAGDTLIADGVVRRGRLVATTTIPAVTGKSFVVRPVSGTVLGHPPDDPTFRRITGAANLVMGWTLDVTKGRARLSTAADSAGDQQSIDAYEGFFTILQGTRSATTDLVLRSGNFDAICGSGGVDIARTAAANTKVVRHLWASGKGKFRTKGRFASAAIRGTEWETIDRCDGTLVRVKTGAVAVFDQVLQKTVVVKAGESYLAQAP